MNEEEKEAIEKFKNFIYTYQEVIEDEYSDYEEKESAKEYQEVSEKLLNLIEKQQKEIEFYKIQELGYIQGYEDGKSHKQTAIAIKIENAEQKFIQRKIERYKENYISKVKIKEKIEEITSYAYTSIKRIIRRINK